MWKRFIGVFVFVLGIVLGLNGSETISVADIKPGMRGQWKTVVSGTELQTFELEVLGVVPNFSGPQQPVIIARALDDDHILSGPVAGMSGSPVYFEGKLAGAYAYGFLWSKEQALIGITPIDNMLEILDFPEQPESDARAVLKPQRQGGVWEKNHLESVPTPLQLSGFSSTTMDFFADQWRELGLDIVGGGGGGGDSTLSDWNFAPGSAVAAVLATGDFSAAATGTVTWVDGDQLLGFGHPFLGMGALNMPMAGAEIITVVRNLRLSFKMARTGPVIGTINQDRLTGVGGTVGPIPPMTNMVVRTHPFAGVSREFKGELWHHPQFMPLLAAMGLMEGGMRTLEGQDRQTFHLNTKIKVTGHPLIEFQNVASGPSGLFPLVLDFQSQLTRLTQNPFAPVTIESLEFDLRTEPEWRINNLREARILSARLRPGSDTQLWMRVEGYREQVIEQTVPIQIPQGLVPGQRVIVQVADASTLDVADGFRNSPAASVVDIIGRMGRVRPQDFIYVRLLVQNPGLKVETQNFPGLPPSVLSQMGHPDLHLSRQALTEIVLWETKIPVRGEFRGEYRIPLTLE